MIGVEEKERIRRAYLVEHRSIRWIARNYHFSRTTVRKALADASSPIYKRKKEPVSKVLEPFKPTIKEWLEEDKTKPKKQCHTGKRIFDRLKGECGFKGAQITVYKYLEKIRPSLKDVYVPIAYDPGIEVQVDFGEAWVYVAGRLTKVHLLCMQLYYSTARFARAYPTERQEAIVDKFSEIRFDHNLYFIPIRYAHRCVSIKGYAGKVKIIKDEGIIAEHPRSYDRKQEILEALHYIAILKRKPSVLEHGRPFKDWRLPQIFEEYRKILKERVDRPEKEYIRLLLLHEDYTTEEIAKALSQAISLGCLSVDAVKIFLNYNKDDPSRQRLDTRTWPEFDAIKVKAPDIKGFNRLLEIEEVRAQLWLPQT